MRPPSVEQISWRTHRHIATDAYGHKQPVDDFAGQQTVARAVAPFAAPCQR